MASFLYSLVNIMKFIIGKKIEMTQLWRDNKVVAVTQIQAGPCTVTQVKKTDKDGYNAIQVGYGEKKLKNVKKPQTNHYKKSYTDKAPEFVAEFKIDNPEIEPGNMINAETFAVGDIIKATGTSKGKGFQGVVKRHGFAGQMKTHGTKDQLRMPGSAGATGPAHVFKGMRMPGQTGNERVTTTNLEIVDVDSKDNIISIKGSVPGARNSIILISGEGELKILKETKDSNIDTEPNKADEKDNPTDPTLEAKSNETKENTV